jgi:hypothetical protein
MLRIGQVFKSRRNPHLNYEITITDISECGEVIRAFCTACSLPHDIQREQFEQLFYLK